MRKGNSYKSLVCGSKLKGAVCQKVQSLKPFQATFNLTYKCNLHCSFCAVEFLKKNGLYFPKSEMGFEEINQALVQFADFGVKQVFFTGGEPFILPFLKKILKRSKELGFKVELVTNGTLLTDEGGVGEVLKYTDRIMVSLDGTRKRHDRLRGVKGAYEKAINFLKLAIKTKKEKGFKTELFTNTILIKEDLGDVLKLLKNLKKMELDYCRVQPLIPFEESNKRAWNSEERQILEKVLKLIESERTKGYFNLIRHSTEESRRPYNFCLVPHYSFFVDYNGNIYPCCFLSGKENFLMGNIKKESIEKIWQRRRYQGFRKKIMNGLDYFVCKNCLTLQDLSANKYFQRVINE